MIGSFESCILNARGTIQDITLGKLDIINNNHRGVKARGVKSYPMIDNVRVDYTGEGVTPVLELSSYTGD